MLLVVVFSDFDIGWRGRKLESVRRNVVLVVREERKWEGGSQRGGSRKEKARVLTCQPRRTNGQAQLTV